MTKGELAWMNFPPLLGGLGVLNNTVAGEGGGRPEVVWQEIVDVWAALGVAGVLNISLVLHEVAMDVVLVLVVVIDPLAFTLPPAQSSALSNSCMEKVVSQKSCHKNIYIT